MNESWEKAGGEGLHEHRSHERRGDLEAEPGWAGDPEAPLPACASWGQDRVGIASEDRAPWLCLQRKIWPWGSCRQRWRSSFLSP